jgi:NTP pyrophosphatase (non-canonical NTP hydrolase)
VKNFELKFALKFSGILKFEHFYIKFMERKVAAFKELLDIMDELRDKCPWDREQTLESLRKLTIEETYELADAILQNDLNGIKKELGDLMLHIVFYAKIGSEKGAFRYGRRFGRKSIKS